MVGQSSFRRILLLRILLLSIPILFLGMAVTFRKARSSLLETARENLKQRAVQEERAIQNSINALQASLAIASETAPLQYGSPASAGLFLKQLQSSRLPTDVRCLQLKDLETAEMIASTCDNRVLDPIDTSGWAKQRNPGGLDLGAYTLTINQINQPEQNPDSSQLNLLLSTPVYNTTGQLRYSLTAQTVIRQTEVNPTDLDIPGTLQSSTIVIDQTGTFLSHPFPGQVGLNIAKSANGDRFQDILTNIQQGNADARLLNLTGDQTEWVVGFAPLKVPTTATDRETWAVLAVTPAEVALRGLDQITQILLILTVGLLAAHLLAMLYMARDLALPIEQLGKYALRIHRRDPLERAPKNFRIRELNHLAEVLDNMVGRLEERAKELESAWQEAEAANQLKSQFLANTSHELRTPLNAIINCIQLVVDDCCDSREEEIDFLQQAHKAAIHLLNIINDILDIQRIEQKKVRLSIETLDLRQIIKDVVDLQLVQIQQKGLELHRTEFPEPILVQADPARLKQVLLNIIYNAIKFTEQGSITVQMRLESGEEFGARAATGNGHRPEVHGSEVGQWVVISVQDTGIGIDPSQQHKLFRPFVMVDGSTTRRFEGTGLGLAISRNLIEMMGGQISLYSVGLGHGTTVKVALPIVKPLIDPALVEPSTNGTAPSIESASIG